MNIVVFISCAGKKEANNIATTLVKEKLCACVNILGNVKSIFWWEKRIDSTKEILLVAKSQKLKFARIIKLVKRLHSYAVPEIIALPIISADKAYLKWLGDSLR
ncbi:MAG: divalent-cation tolerance protein CutA [Candidatus Omnitrophica bacterium]|nr:divalent-cation tolerance protein CutA [Candidatus Omnitrophota bacterium]